LIATVPVVIALLLQIPRPSQPPPPTPPKATQDKQRHEDADKSYVDAKKKTPRDTPATLPENISVGRSSERKNRTEDTKNEPAPDWITRFTAVIAVAAIIQLYIYWKQAYYMRRSLEETKKAADAATKGADVAEKALRLSHRAYLGVGEFAFEFSAAEQMPRITYVVINSGRTRAKLLKSTSTYTIGIPLPPDPLYANPIIDCAEMQVEPGQWFRRGDILTACTPDQFEDIKSGALAFSYWGYIHYRDEFGQSHTTSFCVTYDPVAARISLDRQPNYHRSD
jgi:hypothetical protein